MFHWNEFDTIKKRCTLFKVGNSKNAKHTKGLDSAWIFDNLKIAGNEYYEKHLNQHNAIFTEADPKKYLDFLRNLLKDRPYVELAYMTGVLPIKKYSSGSELNMFDEFYFPTDTIYDTFFGFTEEEVKELCERNKKNSGTIQYEQLAEWYNGYYTAEGKRLYNPRSINKALSQNTVKDYWTETGPGTEILELVKNNVDAVKEDIIKMVSGEKIYFPLRYFKTGYIAKLAQNSDVMLEATLAGNTEKE